MLTVEPMQNAPACLPRTLFDNVSVASANRVDLSREGGKHYNVACSAVSRRPRYGERRARAPVPLIDR